MTSDTPYTPIIKEARLSALGQVGEMLKQHEITSVAEFHDLMAAVFVHGGMEMRRLSDDLGYSFSTVFRWAEGRTAPHQSLWPRITAWVQQEIAKQCNLHEA
jgi:hypothetical protein